MGAIVVAFPRPGAIARLVRLAWILALALMLADPGGFVKVRTFYPIPGDLAYTANAAQVLRLEQDRPAPADAGQAVLVVLAPAGGPAHADRPPDKPPPNNRRTTTLTRVATCTFAPLAETPYLTDTSIPPFDISIPTDTLPPVVARTRVCRGAGAAYSPSSASRKALSRSRRSSNLAPISFTKASSSASGSGVRV